MYHTIVDEGYPVPESGFNDPVFSEAYGHLATNSKVNDIDYDEGVAHSVHIFSDYVEDLYAIHHNNIVTPVIQKNKLNIALSEYVDNKRYKHGVYIVEKFSFRLNSISNITPLMKNYMEHSGINLDKYTVGSLEAWAKNNLNTNSRNNYSIRLVYFIPVEEINEHQHIYHSKSNLLISKECNIKHPKSKAYIENNSKKHISNIEDKNIFYLDIVDNENPGKFFYINIGNKPRKIFSRGSDSEASGAHVLKKLNGNIIDDETRELDKISELGIFETYKEALNFGDVTAELTNKKIDLEHKKIDTEVAMIDKRNGHETEMFTNKLILSNMDITKREKELEIFLEKTKVEIKILLLKSGAEIEKMKSETKTKRVKDVLDIIKIGIKLVF